MEDSVPPGVRPVARVLLLGPEQQLLLLLAQDTVRNHFSWVTPGGGLEAGESFERAASRARRHCGSSRLMSLLGDAANVTV
jgi:ADP-ribose pyrophosphatase YjhB (NUDIX family)